MTISQMHTAIKIKLDKISSYSYPNFENTEIDFFINSAIKLIVKNTFLGNNKNRDSVEETQKRIEDLRFLIREVTLACSTGTLKPNSFTADLSTIGDYWMKLGEEVTIAYTRECDSASITKRVGIKEITTDNYVSYLNDPFSEHLLSYSEIKPLRLFYNDLVELITDGNYTVTNYYIRYIKKPVEVNLSTVTDTDLPELIHEDIVDFAVNMMLESIESPRYNTHTVELHNSDLK